MRSPTNLVFYPQCAPLVCPSRGHCHGRCLGLTCTAVTFLLAVVGGPWGQICHVCTLRSGYMHSRLPVGVYATDADGPHVPQRTKGWLVRLFLLFSVPITPCITCNSRPSCGINPPWSSNFDVQTSRQPASTTLLTLRGLRPFGLVTSERLQLHICGATSLS